MPRPQVTAKQVSDAMGQLQKRLYEKIDKHGDGAYASPHETFGILWEEVDEANDEMRSGNDAGFSEELIDIAVTCIFGVASESGLFQWGKWICITISKFIILTLTT